MNRDHLQKSFADSERLLWNLCYRMTGVAADADDLVQETFARALEHPPAREELPLRPWLTRIAVNAATDLLRKRSTEKYRGPWLPSPIETPDAAPEAEPPAHEPDLAPHASAERRYELLESVSFAFLLALEALTPQQRAVLLLRDVFDYSVAEAADALDLTEANVKTTHHRARAALEKYDAQRERDWRAARERNVGALMKLVDALRSADPAAMEALFTEDVVALSDGAGEFRAAMVPLVGPSRVARFLHRLVQLRGLPESAELRWLNGAPAVVMTHARTRDPLDPLRSVMRVEVCADGKIRAVHSVVASRKLTAVAFPAPATAE